MLPVAVGECGWSLAATLDERGGLTPQGSAGLTLRGLADRRRWHTVSGVQENPIQGLDAADPTGSPGGDGARRAFEVGHARRQIAIEARGYAMSGYGMAHHRALRTATPLWARAMAVGEPGGRQLVIACVDLAMVTHAMRSAATERLGDALGESWWDEGFVLTATHTHSAPGGCGYEALYNLVTPGFVPEHLEAVTEAVTAAVLEARASMEPAGLHLSRSRFAPEDPVAWNRSLRSHNRNPEVSERTSREAHLALDREMAVLTARRDGAPEAFVSLFGVHATCIGNTHDAHDGDNKGYAAAEAESRLASRGRPGAVAIFAQGTAGDVSPHYHGPGQRRRRRRLRRRGDRLHARRNGRLQADRAFEAIDREEQLELVGPIDAALTYRDLSNIEVDPALAGGATGARTSDPCHGAAFFTGTPVDGPGAPRAVGWVARLVARGIRWWRLSGRGPAGEREYYEALYASQDPKAIVLEASRKRALGRPLDQLGLPDVLDPAVAELKRQARSGALAGSPLVPSVLPMQIVRIGTLAIVCCPGEFTTVAGGRMRGCVAGELAALGITEVLVMTYCNDYMGYVTTAEEYDEQRYEGGHTIFGRFTLGAFQTIAADLARQLAGTVASSGRSEEIRPPTVPAGELAARSGLAPRGGGS